jgi:DNA-binding response OmpR family regulator
VILIVSSSSLERLAFSALCESRNWSTYVCSSLAEFQRRKRKLPTRVVIVRNKLSDGYSDDIVRVVRSSVAPKMKIIVLIDASTSSGLEARQIALGADLVYRDPIRTDVLSAYLERYATDSRPIRAPSASAFEFAGATVRPLELKIQYRGRVAVLTQRQLALIEYLGSSPNIIIAYESLYSDILQRKFSGDTSNMRVLLNKLSHTLSLIGLDLRMHVTVVPKVGYRYAK